MGYQFDKISIFISKEYEHNFYGLLVSAWNPPAFLQLKTEEGDLFDHQERFCYGLLDPPEQKPCETGVAVKKETGENNQNPSSCWPIKVGGLIQLSDSYE